MNKVASKKLEDLLESVGDMALKRRAREIIDGINPRNGDKVLDLGCGDGFYLFLLSNLGFNLELVGSDFDQLGLEAAKRNLKNEKISFTRGDLMKRLPFASNEFDKIILSEVAEHLPDDLKGLKEVRRVLKPGGTLCISVPNANYPLFWDPVNWIAERIFGVHIKSGFWAGLWFNHIRLYRPEQLRHVIGKAGFKIKELRSLTWWCLPFNHYLVNLVARLLWGGKLSPKLVSSINKYEKNPQRMLLITLVFKIVNALDHLNDFYQPQNCGVGVFAKVQK